MGAGTGAGGGADVVTAVPCIVRLRGATAPVKFTVQVALFAPAARGENWTPNEQLVPGAITRPLMHCAVPDVGAATRKSDASPDAAPMAGVLNVTFPAAVFVNRTLTTPLVLPTVVLGKSAGLGDAMGVAGGGPPTGGGATGGGGGGRAMAT